MGSFDVHGTLVTEHVACSLAHDISRVSTKEPVCAGHLKIWARGLTRTLPLRLIVPG